MINVYRAITILLLLICPACAKNAQIADHGTSYQILKTEPPFESSLELKAASEVRVEFTAITTGYYQVIIEPAKNCPLDSFKAHISARIYSSSRRCLMDAYLSVGKLPQKDTEYITQEMLDTLPVSLPTYKDTEMWVPEYQEGWVTYRKASLLTYSKSCSTSNIIKLRKGNRYRLVVVVVDVDSPSSAPVIVRLGQWKA